LTLKNLRDHNLPILAPSNESGHFPESLAVTRIFQSLQDEQNLSNQRQPSRNLRLPNKQVAEMNYLVFTSGQTPPTWTDLLENSGVRCLLTAQNPNKHTSENDPRPPQESAVTSAKKLNADSKSVSAS
jgi:hypothetical protein